MAKGLGKTVCDLVFVEFFDGNGFKIVFKVGIKCYFHRTTAIQKFHSHTKLQHASLSFSPRSEPDGLLLSCCLDCWPASHCFLLGRAVDRFARVVESHTFGVLRVHARNLQLVEALGLVQFIVYTHTPYNVSNEKQYEGRDRPGVLCDSLSAGAGPYFAWNHSRNLLHSVSLAFCWCV